MADASSIVEAPPRDTRVYDSLALSQLKRSDELLAWLAGGPIVPPALGLGVGIALDSAWHLPLGVALFLFFISGCTILIVRERDGLRHLAIGLAALAMGALLHDTTYRRWPADSLVRHCASTPTPVRVSGTLLTAPMICKPQMGRVEWFAQLPTTRLLIEADSIEGLSGPIHVSGTVSVKVEEPVLPPLPGDRVMLFGRMYRPMTPEGDDDRDWARANRRNGVLVEMSCDHAANVVVLSRRDAATGWRGLLATLRRQARMAMLDRAYPGETPGSNLLDALVLGQRSAVDPTINQNFVDTGTVHYLSVSGSHVGMLASVLWIIALLAGVSRRNTAMLIAIAITAYGILSEPNPPIWRSVIMGDLLCAAVLLRRPVRVANWLALSAIILLIMHPTDLFDPGFQLSFGTLISLIYLGPPMGRVVLRLLRRVRGVNDPLLAPEIQRMFEPATHRRVGWWIERFVALSLGVGLAAWVSSLALGAYHFNQVSLWGWLNSLLIAPVVFVPLVLGLFKTVLTWIWPVLGAPLGPPLAWSTSFLIWVVRELVKLPGSPLPPLHVTAMGAAAFTLLLLAWMLRGWLRVNRRWLGLITLAFAVVGAWRMAPPASSNELVIDILPVGSGSAHVIRLPSGRTLLYDCGSRPPYDLQRWTLGPMLARANIYRLDSILLSHPDLDHFSAVPDVLDRESVGQLVTTEFFERLASPGGPASRLVKDFKASRLKWQTVKRGESLRGGGPGVQIECLWPPPASELPMAISTNDSSMVLQITYGGHSVLLCGDVGELAEQRLIQTKDIHADVLVLPHHGSMTDFTRWFIEMVHLAFCLRSSGQRDADTHNGLLSVMKGKFYLNTAEQGAIRIRMTPGGLEVRAAHHRSQP